MKLVVGLRNPGPKYERTRHNAGAWWVERVARAAGASFRTERRFQGAVARLAVDTWLLLPDTFMNHSGRAVAALAGFYKIAPGDVLVAHDELDLPPGIARLKLGGGVAGHNGLKDISAAIGRDFWRLRIGIGHPREQAGEQEVADYVLHTPRAAEQELIDGALERALDVWPLLAAHDSEAAMLKLHTEDKKKP